MNKDVRTKNYPYQNFYQKNDTIWLELQSLGFFKIDLEAAIYTIFGKYSLLECGKSLIVQVDSLELSGGHIWKNRFGISNCGLLFDKLEKDIYVEYEALEGGGSMYVSYTGKYEPLFLWFWKITL